MNRLTRLTERVRHEIKRHRRPPLESVWLYCDRCHLRVNPDLVPEEYVAKWGHGPGGESYCPKCALIESKP